MVFLLEPVKPVEKLADESHGIAPLKNILERKRIMSKKPWISPRATPAGTLADAAVNGSDLTDLSGQR